jgi:GR25 family glycosyltransferase involved in LPS biosynthesis
MSNPFDFFDKIFCINLDSRKDRWEKCLEKFALLGIEGKVERFSALTLAHLTDIPHEALAEKGLKLASAGCALSHATILRKARELKLDNYLVLEDDFDLCCLPEECLKTLELSSQELPTQWNIFYLGANLTEEFGTFPLERFTNNLFKLNSCHATHSFAVNSNFYEILDQSLPTQENVFRWLIEKKAIDNHLSENILPSSLTFIPNKMLFIQMSGFSDIDNEYYDSGSRLGIYSMKRSFESFKDLLIRDRVDLPFVQYSDGLDAAVIGYDPLFFLDSSLFAVLAKYIYGLLLLNKRDTSYGEGLCDDLLEVWNDCQYGNEKQGIEEYKSSFKDFLLSVQKEGLNPQRSKARLANPTSGYRLVNGGYRTAACILFNRPTPSEEGRKRQQNVDYKYFRNKKDFKEGALDTKYCDSLALEYCKIERNTFIATIFPSAEGDTEEAERIITAKANIFYKKSLRLNPNGALNLVRQMYNGKPWAGTQDNGCVELKEKARLCFQKDSDVNVYVITVNDPKHCALIKEEVRKVFNIGNHSIHINDSREETLVLSRCFFNDNSIRMMNLIRPNYYKAFHDLAYLFFKDLIVNRIDPDNYCLAGGSVLSVLGLGEGKGLEYLHRGPLIDVHPDIYSYNEYSKERHTKTIDDIIYNPENHFYFNGLKYASLEVVKSIKEKRGGVTYQNQTM